MINLVISTIAPNLSGYLKVNPFTTLPSRTATFSPCEKVAPLLSLLPAAKMHDEGIKKNLPPFFFEDVNSFH